MELDAKIPSGALPDKWDRHKFEMKLVNPANRRKFTILVVGTGLAGASAAATLAGLGYNVKAFCIQDSPRRAHSIAAQGGINAAKNYAGDGDSILRLFYDTIKGGDFRAREANVYRLAQISVNIIDQCVAQGVPFNREYDGLLANRSFGGAQVSRTFYCRGQTGQQLLLGAYGALMCQVNAGRVQVFPRREMLDLVVIDGKARGIAARNLITGEIESHAGDAVVLATGGYVNSYYLSTNAVNSNATAIWRCHKRGAVFANPCFVQIHPTCLPVTGDHQSKLTAMSEGLRNDGRVWLPKKKGDKRRHDVIPESERDYYLERQYPSFGNLVPRDIASRSAKAMCDEGLGIGETGFAVYLDFADAIRERGIGNIREKYGNLFDMYHRITGENPYETPMRIYPAAHYPMGGLWVDYNLMSTIPGLHVLGEANFSDHGANRLGASALMQTLGDGYFLVPSTIGNYLASYDLPQVTTDHPAFKEVGSEVDARIRKLHSIRGKKTVREFHRELGRILWDDVGISRNEAGLKHAITAISNLRGEFWQNAMISRSGETLNKDLEFAGRVADYLELGELMARDALHRQESCGVHFREESQTDEGETKRDDEKYSYVAAWEYVHEDSDSLLHKEPLNFENVELTQRSYR